LRTVSSEQAHAMSSRDDVGKESRSEDPEPPDSGLCADLGFGFIPDELAITCRTLVDSYHNIHGYSCLPDMLWHSDARDVIECHRDLLQTFKIASKARGAKRANDSFILIATVIASLEVLARDFAGWGQRFPEAKREADGLLVDFPSRRRVWFMDMYLYPSLGKFNGFASALA
jgi:hypothetical protein